MSRADLDAAIDAFRAKALQFDATSMMAQLTALAFFENAQRCLYRFPEVEYVGLVYWHETGDTNGARRPTHDETKALLDDVGRVFGKASMVDYQDDDGDAMEEIIRALRSSGRHIRVPAYPVHQERVITGLFSPFDAEIGSRIGFTSKDCVRAFSVFVDVYNKRREKWLAASSHGDLMHSEHFQTLGDYLTFDAASIAIASGVQADIVTRVLEAFSIARGEPAAHVLRPSPMSMLRDRPLLALGDGRYLAPNMDLLLYAVQPRIESLLPRNSQPRGRPLFHRYERHRATWVEGEAHRLLVAMMPHGMGQTAAYYPHEGSFTEGDIVYKVDDVVFLIECKAGAFSNSALRGSPDQLPRDIVDIITEGHKQATRAEQYILQGGRTFHDRSGRPTLTLQGKIREIIRCVVTLAPAGILGTGSAMLHNAGFFPGKPTWVVSLTDFMIVAACMSTPGEFRYYARSRTASLWDDSVIAFDETDYLGIYAKLNTITIPDFKTILPQFSDDFDDFFLERGARSAPGQRMETNLEGMMFALAHAHLVGWTHAVCDIFKLPGEQRQMLAERIARLRKHGAESPCHFSIGDADRWAITVIVHDKTTPTEMQLLYANEFFTMSRPFRGKRLVISYNPVTREAAAEYYWGNGQERLYFAPPTLFWTSL